MNYVTGLELTCTFSVVSDQLHYIPGGILFISKGRLHVHK